MKTEAEQVRRILGGQTLLVPGPRTGAALLSTSRLADQGFLSPLTSNALVVEEGASPSIGA